MTETPDLWADVDSYLANGSSTVTDESWAWARQAHPIGSTVAGVVIDHSDRNHQVVISIRPCDFADLPTTS